MKAFIAVVMAIVLGLAIHSSAHAAQGDSNDVAQILQAANAKKAQKAHAVTQTPRYVAHTPRNATHAPRYVAHPPRYVAHPPRYVTPAPRVIVKTTYYGNASLDAIAQASARWGVSFDWLVRVARCESGLNPGAYNPSGASGLFQFMPSTYWAYAARIGETRSYWNPYGAANVAAYMFSIGQSYAWTCR